MGPGPGDAADLVWLLMGVLVFGTVSLTADLSIQAARRRFSRKGSKKPSPSV